MNSLLNYDIELLRWIQSSKIDFLDSFFYWISYSTTHVAIALVLLVSALFFFYKKCDIEKINYIKFNIIFFASIITGSILKYIFSRPRPFVTYPDILQMYESTTSSFPSGHSITAFSLAIGIMFLQPKRIYVVIAFCWAVTIAYSRMILGSHYPSDVITSIAIVFLYSIILHYLSEQAKVKTKGISN
ncbi:MAG: phosphatase PAP2 family protein [Balneolaceae bacterium]